MKVNSQLHALAALPPEKESPAVSDWKDSWNGDRLDLNMMAYRKLPARSGSRTPVVQPVASHYV